jgi:hypothetical protein
MKKKAVISRLFNHSISFDIANRLARLLMSVDSNLKYKDGFIFYHSSAIHEAQVKLWIVFVSQQMSTLSHCKMREQSALLVVIIIIIIIIIIIVIIQFVYIYVQT